VLKFWGICGTYNTIVELLRHLARVIRHSDLAQFSTRAAAISYHVLRGRLKISHLRLSGRRKAKLANPHIRAVVICHIYYPELCEELLNTAIRGPFVDRIIITCPPEKFTLINNKVFDLVDTVSISCPPEKSRPIQANLRAIGGNTNLCEIKVVATENIGRDVAPFLKRLDDPWVTEADLLLKIHSKRSPYLVAGKGNFWRQHLLESLSPTSSNRRQGLAQILSKMGTSTNTHALWPIRWAYSVESWGENRAATKNLWLDKRQKMSGPLLFPAGTMFWCNRAFVKNLTELPPLDFKPNHHSNENALDGTPAHAVERAFGQLALANGSVTLSW
jgi:lipopolysaccharide biosynthesis protein